MRDIWIYSDADNTLWDTDGVFVRAQLQLLHSAEQLTDRPGPSDSRLDFVRRLDQALASKHHSGLRYPPILLLKCIRAVLEGMQENDAVRESLAARVASAEGETDAIELYQAAIHEVPPLLPGVREGLELAGKTGLPVFVVTEGPLHVAQQRIGMHGLSDLLAGTLSATKTVELYSRLIRKASPRVAAMIGDQPDKDVRLAHEAGMLTVFIPGRFQPAWLTTSDSAVASAVCSDFKAAINWLKNESERRHVHPNR